MFIYAIENTVNGKRYIGQTGKTVSIRFSQHKHHLRLGKHRNPHLQFAWNKYGHDVFICHTLKECSTQEELDLEEERFRVQFHPHIYNTKSGGMNGVRISNDMRKNMAKATKKMWLRPEYKDAHLKVYKGFISPDRVVYTNIKELKKFAKEHNLTLSLLVEVHQETQKHHKGWIKFIKDEETSYAEYHKKLQRTKSVFGKTKNKNTKTVSGLVAPDGTIYAPITNLYAFCKEHNLVSHGNIHNVVTGKKTHYKGWTKYQLNEVS